MKAVTRRLEIRRQGINARPGQRLGRRRHLQTVDGAMETLQALRKASPLGVRQASEHVFDARLYPPQDLGDMCEPVAEVAVLLSARRDIVQERVGNLACEALGPEIGSRHYSFRVLRQVDETSPEASSMPRFV